MRLHVITYGAEIVILNNKTENKIQVKQRALERSILGVSQSKRGNPKKLNEKMVADALRRMSTLKWNWASHIARMNDYDNLWTIRILE